MECPGDVRLEFGQDRRRVLVGALPDALRLELGPIQDPPPLILGGLGQAALLDQESGLFLGPSDDRLGFFLGLLDDPLTLGVDPFGCPDLLRDRYPQLVDQPECGALVKDDIAGEGQLLPAGDQVLESRDEEDDVDRTGPPWLVTANGGAAPSAELSHPLNRHAQGSLGRTGHHRPDVAAESGDLADQGGTDVAVLE